MPAARIGFTYSTSVRSGSDADYIADFLDERDPETGNWVHSTLIADKSRQLWLSWFCILRLDWIAQKDPLGECLLISKTDSEGTKILKRIGENHSCLPPIMKKALGLAGMGPRYYSVSRTGGIVRYTNGSTVEALPQRGGDAARSHVPSAYLLDEAAFQEHFRQNWQAIRGTASDARTQGMVVTTAAPSFFQETIEDRQDGDMGGRAEVFHESKGLTIWRNIKNRLWCARIHYTADPARRTAEWAEQAKEGMPMYQWRAEQEIDYAARGGRVIFPQFDRESHQMKGSVKLSNCAASTR